MTVRVTTMLAEIGLSSFEAVVYNSKTSFLNRWNSCANSLV